MRSAGPVPPEQAAGRAGPPGQRALAQPAVTGPRPAQRRAGRVTAESRARPRPPQAYRALLAVCPGGALREVPLAPPASASAAVRGLLDCLQPARLPLTRHLDMWATGDSTHSLPLNVLAAGLGLRHGLSPRCYHGTVLLCGTAPGPRPAGLSIDQVLAVLAQIDDIADAL